MEERTTSSTGGQKGVKLARFDLIPAEPLRFLAEHFGKGARKYAEHQWRQGYEWSKSYSAIQRHLNEFWAGRDYDVCSNDPGGCSMVTADGDPFEPLSVDTCYNHTGSHHLDCVMWHSFVLREFVECFPQHDDRYLPQQPEIDFNEVAIWSHDHEAPIARYTTGPDYQSIFLQANPPLPRHKKEDLS